MTSYFKYVDLKRSPTRDFDSQLDHITSISQIAPSQISILEEKVGNLTQFVKLMQTAAEAHEQDIESLKGSLKEFKNTKNIQQRMAFFQLIIGKYRRTIE